MAKKAYDGNEKNIRSVRLQEILRLVGKETVKTQQDLLKRLEEEGYSITQGTLSRDIRDLNLVKEAVPGGGTRYVAAKKLAEDAISGQFHALYKSAAAGAESALNQVVIRCHTGMAGAVCAAMDQLSWEGLLGTIAGDDTILVIMKTEKQAEELVGLLKTIQ